MNRRHFAFAATALAALSFSSLSLAADELRVMVHSSFALPKPLLADFEKQAGVKLALIKGGDAGEMLNKLILTRANPVADVVYGIDNTLQAKAHAAGVLDGALQPVDYGYVTLNFDKTAMAKNGLVLPTTLQQLTQPAYKAALVMPNPATSSTGYAFLLATIAGLGEEPAFAWWAQMRANGLKVAKGWSEAYYTDFTRGGGAQPMVVSYATSPAAEVFYATEKRTQSPTGSLTLKGGVFKQTEGVALLKGGGQRAAALKFIDFMRSGPVQQALQTEMWMYPVLPGTPRAPVMQHATEPTQFETLPVQTMADKGSQWVARWTQVVLK
ncbi:thiamine ABC transporter substrate-binding protein [Rhodoferax sp.]|uniref:thiamine ABC transporter substrate-binding protein n=1 Tax=Rhodoferax sp. TaxID=50421 RepID=UPI002636C1FD|nr:thiamine ABC transporter substrate-binding protein [Rhodoferax sp.]MDD5001016.1 thiamine ABC transporter substrate-binding protein [Thiomonas arsenitoxydans]MDD5480000.1 thiamine ABC transporter substrate-binding protein [Rhodoferax sp.]